jgi:hypothetical protein
MMMIVMIKIKQNKKTMMYMLSQLILLIIIFQVIVKIFHLLEKANINYKKISNPSNLFKVMITKKYLAK